MRGEAAEGMSPWTFQRSLSFGTEYGLMFVRIFIAEPPKRNYTLQGPGLVELVAITRQLQLRSSSLGR